MRRIVLFIIILTILTLSIFIVYNNYIDKSKIFKIDIRGTVKNISIFGDTATILVEGQKEADTYYDKASIRIDKKTLITKVPLNRIIDISEITVGDKVEVTFIGPVAESYPVQAVAELVNLIE
ncbi:MAG: DUF3221 domain-containing protein [Clostridia bacterium]|nr:DUF3221 domain-containing protein [Clostridia bacterium]MDD4387122.1 DUF3221 domain-containing protein [Clostridia bacterium]